MGSNLIPFILGMSGVVYNDVLALVSLAGCILLFLGSLPGACGRLYTALGEWSTAPLYFGSLFQIAMFTTGLTPEKIGVVLPMAPGLVNALFAVSFLLLGGRWWLGRSPTRP